jgi:hypothetical protein
MRRSVYRDLSRRQRNLPMREVLAVRTMLARIVIALLLSVAPLAAPQAAAARGITLGFFDGQFSGANPGPVLTQAQQVGSRVVRITPRWSDIAPATRPPSFDPTNPDDPAYDWSQLDADVRAAQAHRQRVLLTIFGAPTWAQGGDKPSGQYGANWKVDPQDVGEFATAIARRYSGTHLDLTGQPLPKVTDWQIWNEPYLYTNFNPQWERVHGDWQPYAPIRYREILNAAYAALKAVSPENHVVTAGTGPFGDLNPGGHRIGPLLFWRYLLCLDRTTGCDQPAHFDVASHHPYSVRGPTAHAVNTNDASVPDVRKVAKLVRAAVRRGGARPRLTKPMWVTELAWDSSPPDPEGIPAARQAAWLSKSVYVLWKQGVSLLVWYQVTGSPPKPSYAASNQGGVFLLDGTPKLSAAAYRFPFVVVKRGKGRLVWGIAPAPGRVRLEALRAGRWRRIRALTAPSDRVFSAHLGRGSSSLRAVQGGVVSPPA